MTSEHYAVVDEVPLGGPADAYPPVQPVREDIERFLASLAEHRDETLRPVALGQAGEIYATGQTARGYLGDPSRTAERFADLVTELVEREGRELFDLERPPLFKVALARLSAVRHLCVITLHHLILDGWSVNRLLADYSSAYEAIRHGRPPRTVQSEIRRGVGRHSRVDRRAGTILVRVAA